MLHCLQNPRWPPGHPKNIYTMLNIYREALEFYNHQDDLSSDDEDENESEDESDEE